MIRHEQNRRFQESLLPTFRRFSGINFTI
jgi:hypothetical protein